MIGDMGTVHITEAELACDLHNILAKVRQGVEMVGGISKSIPG